MVQRRQRERSLFEVLLPDGHKLWPDWLRKIDTLLEDEAVIEVVAQGLEARWPQSRRRGRFGTPAEVVIRMLILKHLFDWSYDDLEREVRANLVYRAFTHIDAGEERTGSYDMMFYALAAVVTTLGICSWWVPLPHRSPRALGTPVRRPAPDAT